MGLLRGALKKTLWHGTDVDVSVLKPMGVNMGHRLAKPEWATFFWGSFEKAWDWAVYQVCRRMTDVTLMYHIPTGKFAITASELSRLVREVNGKKAYVYEVELPRASVGLGSSPDIEEYTYNKEVRPTKKTQITLDKGEIEKSAVVMSGSEYEKYRKDVIDGRYAGARGVLYSLFMDSERDQKRHDYHRRMRRGELSPGDDLT